MNACDDPDDVYADLREVSNQLARLLAMDPAPLKPQHQEKLNDLLSRLQDHVNQDRLKSPDRSDHHSGAVRAKKRIEAERQADNPPPSRHIIGKELVRIAGAVDGCVSLPEDAATLAGDAMELAVELTPVLLL